MQLISPFHSPTNPIPWRAFTLLLGIVTAGVLNGCAFMQPHADPTKFYVLTSPGGSAQPAPAREAVRWKIGLRPIEMPAYLQTKLMVVRTGASEIQFAEFDRWAEPLDAGISRVMKETLGSAPNVESVALNSRGDDTLNYEIKMRVQACEGVRGAGGNGSISLAMSWEIRSLGTDSTLVQCGGFTARAAVWDGSDYGQLAMRLSEAIAHAGLACAADLPKATVFDGNQPRK